MLRVGDQGERLDGEGLAAAPGKDATGGEAAAARTAQHPLECYLQEGNSEIPFSKVNEIFLILAS